MSQSPKDLLPPTGAVDGPMSRIIVVLRSVGYPRAEKNAWLKYRSTGVEPDIPTSKHVTPPHHAKRSLWRCCLSRNSYRTSPLLRCLSGYAPVTAIATRGAEAEVNRQRLILPRWRARRMQLTRFLIYIVSVGKRPFHPYLPGGLVWSGWINHSMGDGTNGTCREIPE